MFVIDDTVFIQQYGETGFIVEVHDKIKMVDVFLAESRETKRFRFHEVEKISDDEAEHWREWQEDRFGKWYDEF